MGNMFVCQIWQNGNEIERSAIRSGAEAIRFCDYHSQSGSFAKLISASSLEELEVILKEEGVTGY